LLLLLHWFLTTDTICRHNVSDLGESQNREKSGELDAEDEEKASKKQPYSDIDDCSLEKLGKLVRSNVTFLCLHSGQHFKQFYRRQLKNEQLDEFSVTVSEM